MDGINLIMSTIGDLKQENNGHDFMLDGLTDKDIYIYGAGNFGRHILSVLKSKGFNVTGFLDRNFINIKNVDNIPVYNPEDLMFRECYSNIIIVLSIVLDMRAYESIELYLRKIGFQEIINGQEIRASYVEYEKGIVEHFYENVIRDMDKIHKVFSILEDEESKRIFSNNLSANLLRDYSLSKESDSGEQYFVKDIPFNKGYRRFLDCGAFVGDTFESLISHIGVIDEYIAYEPVKSSFEELVSTVKRNQNKVNSSILYMAGVSNTNGNFKFVDLAGSNFESSDGTLDVQTVRIDDTLINAMPTFVKMDIEGFELDALLGAKDLISRCKPDLAICLYHYINHIFEIPLLINSWNLGYKFYIRCHSSAGMETVLYATAI